MKMSAGGPPVWIVFALMSDGHQMICAIANSIEKAAKYKDAINYFIEEKEEVHSLYRNAIRCWVEKVATDHLIATEME
jgi:hypothetical protein